MSKIERFMMHNDRGESILCSDLIAWAKKKREEREKNGGEFVPFDTKRYSWIVSGEYILREEDSSMHILPDEEGFLLVERRYTPDNCVILDAYGKEKIRLTIPWELTYEKKSWKECLHYFIILMMDIKILILEKGEFLE